MDMIPYSYILWTDSSQKTYDGRGYCGYGCVILNTRTMKFAMFGDYIGDVTIACGELMAIYKGIKKTLQFIGKDEAARILIVSDNKLAVTGFSYYIPYKWDISNWYHWKTVKGKPVKNQGIYRKTLELIRKYSKVKIRIAHMHSHTGKNGKDKIRHDLKNHGIVADKETVDLFQKMNAEVDRLAGEKVVEQIERDKKMGPVPETLKRKNLFD